MNKVRLGVNIDHVATLRNARGEKYPEPIEAASIVKKSGADSVTLHLREDRRHIRDSDVVNILKKVNIPVNLEIASTNEMFKIALKYKPNFVCLVPEKRAELTTEGGLNIKKKFSYLRKMIPKLKEKKIRVTLFINPNISDIKLAKKSGADGIEIHTGKFCSLFNNIKKRKFEYKKIKESANFAHNIGLHVHAGHGLTYRSAAIISKIKFISELNIGHFIIAESVFISLKESIKLFKKIINR
jgi:pyridoxine 5-phosphate synthase